MADETTNQGSVPETTGTGAPQPTMQEPTHQTGSEGAAPQGVSQGEPQNPQPTAEGMDVIGSILDSGETDTAPAGAPEAYDVFKDSDGNEYGADQVAAFAEVAKELNLTQESAQKVFGAMVPAAREYLQKDLVAKAKGWAEATKSDPEIGGANFKVNKGIAASAYRQYATPELRAILGASGLSNHPEVVRLFLRIGKSMQQDHGVAGSASSPAMKRRRYPNSNMVADMD